jgi:rare lipoprotein A
MRAHAAQLLSALVITAGASAALPARAGAPATLTESAATGRAAPQPPAWEEHGEATWYGPRHEGRRTTSGERFDSSKLTAAHASLPMGAWVKVTVEDTGRSIIVRVNDREPPHGVRCIDLTREAASRLGIIGRGVADVSVAQISAPPAGDQPEELAEAPDSAQPVQAVSTGHHRARARHSRRHARHVHS